MGDLQKNSSRRFSKKYVSEDKRSWKITWWFVELLISLETTKIGDDAFTRDGHLSATIFFTKGMGCYM